MLFTDSITNSRATKTDAMRDQGIRVCVLALVPFCDKSRHPEPARPAPPSSHGFVIKRKSAGRRGFACGTLRRSVFNGRKSTNPIEKKVVFVLT